MKRKWFAYTVLALFVFLLAGVSGCRRGGEKPQAVFRVAIPRPITSLDPIRVGDALTLQVHINAYETLVGVDRDGYLVPGVARSWEVKDDGKRWIFHLGEHRFCDEAGGGTVTAEDVIATYERAATNRRSIIPWVFRDYVEGAAAFMDGKASSISGLIAKSDKELEVRLTRPLDIASRFALPQLSILPAKMARDPNLDLDTAKKSYGSGPYKVVSVGPDKVVFEANKNSAIRPAYSKAEFVVYRDVESALAQAKAGRVDMVSVPLTHWKQVVSGKLDVPFEVLNNTVHFEHYILNTRDRVLADRHLRRALMLAIDRKRLCEDILSGGCIPTDFTAAMARRTAEDLYDLSEARREWRMAKVHPKEISLVTTPEYEQQLVAAYLQDQWKAAFGIQVKVSSIEFGSLMANLFGGRPFQIARFWVQPLVDLPEIWFMTFRPGNPPPHGRNFSGYQSEEFASLFERSLLPLPGAQKEKLIEQMEEILRHDVPVIPLFQRKYAYVYSKRAYLPVGYALRYHLWEAVPRKGGS